MRKEAQNGKLGVYGFPCLSPWYQFCWLQAFTLSLRKSDQLILIVSQINKAI